MCLLESCTKVEFDNLILLLGGRDRAQVLLNGKWKLSKSYAKRMKAIEDCHTTFPEEPQYVADMTITRASAVNFSKEPGLRFMSSRRGIGFSGKRVKRLAKDTAIKTRKVVRKSACCLVTGLYVTALTLISFTLYAWFFAIPRTLWPYWGKSWSKQRIRGIFIILGVVLLSAGITLGLGAIVWLFIFRIPYM